jgi:pimeloyl-ACP methyl ester carboxylesterase
MKSAPALLLAIVPALLIAIACTSSSSDGDATPTPTASPSSDESATPTATPKASFTFSDCRFEVPDNYDVTCGYLIVPEDRDDPDSETIRLHVAIFKSTSGAPSDDPVIYLDGGPGGKTLETLSLSFDDSFADLLFDRDVIMFDQRGVGFSEPALDCPEIDDASEESIATDLTEEEFAELFTDAAVECRNRLTSEGVDLSAYNSAESAADVADLRRVLGYDEWNLYGISYGTKLALTTARDHPKGIRSIVLDSVYPLEVDLYGEIPANTVRALNVLFDQCNADPECASAYPGLEQVLIEESQRLQANPVTTDLRNPFTGEVIRGALINGDALIGTMFQSLYDWSLFPLLPQMVFEVRDGDYELLGDLLGFFQAQDDFITGGMHLAVQCHEEAVFTSAEAVIGAAAQFSAYGEYLAADTEGFFETCAVWNDESADGIENEAVVSDISALVMAGEWDPITPPSWGVAVAANLENSTIVEFPGLGHAVSVGDSCPQSIMRRFLTSPESNLDLSCVEQMEEPDFFVP